jgi:hypothetical protein
MPKATLAIAKTHDSSESITLADSKDLCFTPRVNNLLTFHDHAKYQELKKTVFKSICGKEDACATGTDYLHVAPIRIVLEELYDEKSPVKYPSLYIMP